MSKQRSRIR